IRAHEWQVSDNLFSGTYHSRARARAGRGGRGGWGRRGGWGQGRWGRRGGRGGWGRRGGWGQGRWGRRGGRGGRGGWGGEGRLGPAQQRREVGLQLRQCG